MNIEIREIEEKDTEHIVKWRNNPNVVKHFIDQRTLTKENHVNWLNNYVRTGKVAQFIIVAEGVDVGSVFIRDIDLVNKTGEYGIFIGEDDYRGKGIGSKASQLILQYAFNNLGIEVVILRVLKENQRAIKSYLNIGFTPIDREDNGVVFMEYRKSTW